MPAYNFNSDEYCDNPNGFIEFRKTIETIDPLRFNAILGGISRIVLSYPEYYFQTPNGRTKTYCGSDDNALMGNKSDVIEEIDGPLRTPDNRVMDLRLFTKEHSLRQSLGFIAFVGIDWKATPHLSDLASSEALSRGLLAGGIHIKSDFDKIDNLWVLSSNNRDHWITSYSDARPITDFEYDQILDDLMAYPSV